AAVGVGDPGEAVDGVGGVGVGGGVAVGVLDRGEQVVVVGGVDGVGPGVAVGVGDLGQLAVDAVRQGDGVVVGVGDRRQGVGIAAVRVQVDVMTVAVVDARQREAVAVDRAGVGPHAAVGEGQRGLPGAGVGGQLRVDARRRDVRHGAAAVVG